MIWALPKSSVSLETLRYLTDGAWVSLKGPVGRISYPPMLTARCDIVVSSTVERAGRYKKDLASESSVSHLELRSAQICTSKYEATAFPETFPQQCVA
jgi:hypothetical protein